MQLNPRQIEAFRMVMLRGSVTAAAQMLNVSQPAVSRLIRDLEIRTGITLFERQANHLVPTPEAALLLVEVERYAVGLEALATYTQELARHRKGVLRVIALPAMAMGFLPRFVASFVGNRDLSRVYLHGMPSHLVIDAVASGQADVGIAAAPAERPGLSIEPLDARVVVALPAGHRLAAKRALRYPDLAGERLIALAEPKIFAGPLPEPLEQMLRDATIVTPLTGIACALVAAGAGIAIVDPFAVAGAGDDRLATVPLEPALPIRTAIITSANRRLSSLALAFIAAFRQHVEATIAQSRPRPRRGPATA